MCVLEEGRMGKYKNNHLFRAVVSILWPFQDAPRTLSWGRNILCRLLGETSSNIDLFPECYNTHLPGRIYLLMQS